ncbi:hypothetical protein ASE37_17675 [Rhizobium sp. Root268]|nr:hypothetical protein ASC86_17760 [Rhizobium sp. Root1212]KRD22540.1 hypothetical protein ASE37_17675 [Rhizobium sp. Root268]
MYEDVGGYRPFFKYSQDNDLWLRMIKQCQFLTVPEVLYIRCIDFDGISYSSDSFARQSAYFILGKYAAQDNQLDQRLDAISTQVDVFEFVSKMHPHVQKVIIRGALRALAFGSRDGATKIAESHIADSTSRAAICALSWVLGFPLIAKGSIAGRKIFTPRKVRRYIDVMLLRT